MTRKYRTGISLCLTAALLAACGQNQAADAPRPVQSAVPSSPYQSVITSLDPALNPVRRISPEQSGQASAAPAGPVDARTGLDQAALVSVSGDADSRFNVLFRPEQTQAARVEAMPAKLCAQSNRTVTNSKTNKPGSGSAMPGVQIMIIECGAA